MLSYIVFAIFSVACCLIAYIIFKGREKKAIHQTSKDLEYVSIILEAIKLESKASEINLGSYPAIEAYIKQSSFILDNYTSSPASIKIESNNLEDLPEDQREFYNHFEQEVQKAPEVIVNLVDAQNSILERMYAIQNDYIFRFKRSSSFKKNITVQILSFLLKVLKFLSKNRAKKSKAAMKIVESSKVAKSLESRELIIVAVSPN